MPTPTTTTPLRDLRPDADTVAILGARVVIVAAEQLLAAAASGRIEMLGDAGYPAPVQKVQVWLEPGTEEGVAVLRFGADIRTGHPPTHVIANAALLAA